MQVVLNDKPARDEFMIAFGFGKGQGFANKATNALAERVIPAFLVSSLPRFLADTAMSTFWEDSLVSLPKIAVGATATVGTRNGIPQRP